MGEAGMLLFKYDLDGGVPSFRWRREDEAEDDWRYGSLPEECDCGEEPTWLPGDELPPDLPPSPLPAALCRHCRQLKVLTIDDGEPCVLTFAKGWLN
jgi:hypothetical protein